MVLEVTRRRKEALRQVVRRAWICQPGPGGVSYSCCVTWWPGWISYCTVRPSHIVVILVVPWFTFCLHLSSFPLPNICHLNCRKTLSLWSVHLVHPLVTESSSRKRSWHRKVMRLPTQWKETNSSLEGKIFQRNFSNYFEVILNLKFLAQANLFIFV